MIGRAIAAIVAQCVANRAPSRREESCAAWRDEAAFWLCDARRPGIASPAANGWAKSPWSKVELVAIDLIDCIV